MREQQKTGQAKQLRKYSTEAERTLWRYLRAHRLSGLKFKRQYPVGPFIADFACVEHSLIVEVDGGQHATQQAYDIGRTEFMQQQGFTVLRFWNNEVLQNIDAVVEMIASACNSPLPNPLPYTGEGVLLHGDSHG